MIAKSINGVFSMNRRFKEDHRYLIKYYSFNIAAFLVILIILLALKAPDAEMFALFIPAFVLAVSSRFANIVAAFVYSVVIVVVVLGAPSPWLYIGCLAVVPIATIWATTFLHNASHNNFKHPLLSRIVGEACAAFQLVGFPDWHVVHNLHHRNSDDVERDPHPPRDLSYWAFLLTMRKSIGRVLTNSYMDHHGESSGAVRAWRSLAYVVPASLLLRLVCWYLLLGPEIFAFFLLASLVAKSLSYAHFNHSTHEWVDGDVEIRNLDHNLFYRCVNIVAFGLYYHRNHHDKPNLFDPRRMPEPVAVAPAPALAPEAVTRSALEQ